MTCSPAGTVVTVTFDEKDTTVWLSFVTTIPLRTVVVPVAVRLYVPAGSGIVVKAPLALATAPAEKPTPVIVICELARSAASRNGALLRHLDGHGYGRARGHGLGGHSGRDTVHGGGLDVIRSNRHRTASNSPLESVTAEAWISPPERASTTTPAKWDHAIADGAGERAGSGPQHNSQVGVRTGNHRHFQDDRSKAGGGSRDRIGVPGNEIVRRKIPVGLRVEMVNGLAVHGYLGAGDGLLRCCSPPAQRSRQHWRCAGFPRWRGKR